MSQIIILLIVVFGASYFVNRVRGVKEPVKNAAILTSILIVAIIVLGILVFVSLSK